MPQPLRYIIVGTGGFGAHWCRDVLPRLLDLSKAVPVAAVDMTPEHLIQCAALLFAAIESAETRQIVDVQEFLRRHLA